MVRSEPADPPPAGMRWLPQGDLTEVGDWSPALDGVHAVVHLAGRAHHGDGGGAISAYRRVNVEATLALAGAAAKAGVAHFVYMSSVKAAGESSGPQGLREDELTHPVDAYGISKREAELALLDPSRFSSMRVTVLRPPLVYGPGVRANFARLLRWVDAGVPLPFGRVSNRRSLVFVGNLSHAVRFVLECPTTDGQACFVSDGEDVSTPELIGMIATAMGRPARLFSVPPRVLDAAFSLLGRKAEADRIFGSLVVRAERLRSAGWHPPFSLREGLRQTVDAYLSGKFCR